MGKKLYGTGRVDEEKHLSETLKIAETNLQKAREHVKGLSDDLQDILELYELKDKEAQTLWRNTESMLQESRRDLMRHEKARKKPYFGRIDIRDEKGKEDETFYIGRVGIMRTTSEQEVIDWRAPVASVYYENALGQCTYSVKKEGTFHIDLKRKRTYEIADDTLIDYFDSETIANDELLTKYLAKSKKAVLGEIIATIQQEQNEIIRKSPKQNILVQGVAGSGKTTVAMHRISYILYNYEEDFAPRDFYIVGSNRILLQYITSVLPDLDVYGISQMTMEQLFVRLLYEDWDKDKIKIVPLQGPASMVKGTMQWFHELEEFCNRYEWDTIPRKQVRTEKTKQVLLTKEAIEKFILDNPDISMQNKILMLNERLAVKLENELLGKDITYTPEEKKEMQRLYRFWFGKKEYTGSIFELYQQFLAEQGVMAGEGYDVYDLAALAYIYKRIKETEVIREASHVVIDEAQDFGMMAYAVLKFCLRGCTYTIMGDVSQNIHYGHGLNDWEELKQLMLSGPFDSFGTLKKSYRNTVEISNFATDILRHGSFRVYPVEPVIRHGNEVRVEQCDSDHDLMQAMLDTLRGWVTEGHETIAVICRDEAEADAVRKALSEQMLDHPVQNGTDFVLLDGDLSTTEFGNGVMVLPVEYTKGLEFDTVLLYNPSETQYPSEDSQVKLLYVAATRALHELVVLHRGDLTGLIANPLSEKQRLAVFEEQKNAEASEKQKSILKGNTAEEAREFRQKEEDKKTLEDYLQERLKGGPKPIEVQSLLKDENAKAAPVITKRTENVTIASSVKGLHTFGEIPEAGLLRAAGHAKVDTSIRWIKKEKNRVELASSYGTLSVMPIADNVIRISFGKGQGVIFEDSIGLLPETNTKWTCKETRDAAGIMTDKLLAKIDRKTGVLQFVAKGGKVLLAEQAKEPRLIEDASLSTRTYFDWSKKEKLSARGMIQDVRPQLNNAARYISFGKEKTKVPCLLSDQGYGLAIAASGDVFVCNIPMYGNYIYTNHTTQIDYYFLYGESTEKTLELYHKLTTKEW